VLETTINQLRLSPRIASIFVDMTLIILLALITSLPGLFIRAFWPEPIDGLDKLVSNASIAFVYSALLNKDILNGQSPGKRQYGFRVVSKNGHAASVIQLITRNVTFIIWPIELLVTMFRPNSRIGDFLGRTKLVSVSNSDLGRSTMAIPMVSLIILITWFPLFLIIRFSTAYFGL